MKTEDIYTENVKNVAISENTRALIACMARMSEIYTAVCNTVEEVYGVDTEKLYPSFPEVYVAFDKELKAIMCDVIDTTALDSEYREI